MSWENVQQFCSLGTANYNGYSNYPFMVMSYYRKRQDHTYFGCEHPQIICCSRFETNHQALPLVSYREVDILLQRKTYYPPYSLMEFSIFKAQQQETNGRVEKGRKGGLLIPQFLTLSLMQSMLST